ncbi:MAG: hypothetical protein K2L56_09615 [Prevotella sp.]|nr:hypothetical protein [Prevotella sp.]
MSAIILMWNPDISSYTKEHFEKDLNEFDTIDEDWYNWSVWEHEKVEESNDFYLVRVGKGNTGIVMSEPLYLNRILTMIGPVKPAKPIMLI